MNIECDVIRDILPLYAEDMVSDKTRQLVDEHIYECADCEKLLAEIMEPEVQIDRNIEPIREFKKSFRKHTATVAVLSVFSTIIAILFIVGIFLSQWEPLAYGMLSFFYLLPMISTICSMILGWHNTVMKWRAPFIFSGIAVLFSGAISLVPIIPIGFDGWGVVLIALVFTFIPSLVGLLIGLIISKLSKKRDSIIKWFTPFVIANIFWWWLRTSISPIDSISMLLIVLAPSILGIVVCVIIKIIRAINRVYDKIDM